MSYDYTRVGPNIVLVAVHPNHSHLVGIFNFENISGERQQAKEVVFRGVRSIGGGFWPHVRYEARRNEGAFWEPLGESWLLGWPTKLTVKAESSPVGFSVRLDVFQSLIGKYEFGRIVLSSGATSQFQLDDLAPPNTQQSSNQTVERTATRLVSTRRVITMSPVFASPVLGRRRSLHSR
jgi:hypothetical protein